MWNLLYLIGSLVKFLFHERVLRTLMHIVNQLDIVCYKSVCLKFPRQHCCLFCLI